MKFRRLNADEIDCRIATISDKGLQLLLFKDARTDQNILDETVGAENWQRDHYECKGNLFCKVGIKCNNEWVWKSDCGTESYTEKEKGEASDSFKRACFNWGIGRELYTAPFIWITDCQIAEKNGKKVCYDKFIVKSISYDDKGTINSLTIINAKTRKAVYTMGKAEESKEEEKITDMEALTLEQLIKKAGAKMDKVLTSYNVIALKDLTKTQYTDCLIKLKKYEK